MSAVSPFHEKAATAQGIAQAVLALSTRNPRRALRLAQRGLARARAAPPAERGRLWRACGHALRAVGDYRAARVAYLRARRVFAGERLALEHAISALGLIDACMYLGRTEDALRAAAEARRVFARRGDRERLAKLETNVGNVYHRVEALEPALRHYERAARFLARAGTPADRARVDYNRANILTHLGRRGESEALYLSARRALLDAGETVSAAQASYGLACLRFLTGDYAAAMAELEQVRPELARLGARPLLALADLDLAEVLVALKLYPEALALARGAGRWFRRRRMPAEFARCDLVAGVAWAHLGRAVEAARALASADRVFRLQGHEPGRAAAALALGRLSWREGRHLEAGRRASRARDGFARTGFPGRALAAAALGAEALLAAGRAARAGTLARGSLRCARRLGDAYSRARLARVAGAAAALQDDREAALRHYRAALAEADRAHAALFVDEWRVGFLEGEPAILDEFMGVLLDRRPRPTPAEVWRWLAHRHGMPPAQRPSGEAGPAHRQAVARLRAELEACYARLWGLRGGAARRALPTAARALECSALRLERRLRRLARPAPGGAMRARRRKPAPARVAAGEVHIAYFSAAGQVAALRRDASGWALVPDLTPLGEAERLLRLLHHQMEARGSDAPVLRGHRPQIEARAREHLARLGRALLDPVLPGGRGCTRIRITPHGPLFRLPFHALRWRGASLAEAAEVSLDPAPGWVPPRATPDRKEVWVMGHSGAVEGAIELEARAVAQALGQGGRAVELRLGAEARADLLPEAARRAALIHLSGHAVYRAEHPEFSAIRLADRWLTASDLAALDLEGACVVLSACETGPRGAVAGDEFLGLVRGLVRAGCSAVIASLWRVDDRATLALMRGLYEAWRRHGELGAALNEVHRAGAASGRDPYLWAPFCLVGNPVAPWPGIPPVRAADGVQSEAVPARMPG